MCEEKQRTFTLSFQIVEYFVQKHMITQAGKVFLLHRRTVQSLSVEYASKWFHVLQKISISQLISYIDPS